MKILVTILISFLFLNSYSQDREFISKEGDKEYHMKMYYMLIYIRGDKALEFSESELQELQSGHMEHIGKMAEANVVRLAGPFEGDGDKRGILVFDLDSEEEVIKWIEEDPAVKAGRLSYEIHAWWTEKGGCLE